MTRTDAQSDVIESLSLQDLCRLCQSDEAWIIELVEQGLLEPQGPTISSWRFFGVSILRAKRAQRLNSDLGINAAGVALVLELLEERDAMVRQMAQLHAD